MSRYRGPRFKKIRRLGALPGLTSKRPRAGSDLRNQSRSGKKSQYRYNIYKSINHKNFPLFSSFILPRSNPFTPIYIPIWKFI